VAGGVTAEPRKGILRRAILPGGNKGLGDHPPGCEAAGDQVETLKGSGTA
jgi:hypothetical protein